MAQPFKNAIITNDGARLLTRAQAGEIRIEFTRIAIGDGQYSYDEKGIETLQNQTTLRSERNSYPLSSIDIFSDHSVKITALITNQDPVTGQTLVDNGYFINEMGLFAKIKEEEIDTEILYSITVTTGTNGDFMPPFNGYYPVHIIQEYYATVNNSAEVTIQAGIGAAILNEDYLKLKSNVGNVDIAKGDLQTQLNRLVENLGNLGIDEKLNFAEGIEADNVIDAINEVFQAGNEKKQKLVENLIAVGVEASTDETWEELLNKIDNVKQVGYNAGLKDNSNTNIAAIINPNDVHVYNGGTTLNITVSKRSAVYIYGAVSGWSHPNCGSGHDARINLKTGTTVVKSAYVKAYEGTHDDDGNYTTHGNGTSCSWNGAVNAGTKVSVEISRTGYYNDSGKCSATSQIIVIGYK